MNNPTRIKPENEITERERKLIGCMQSSLLTPISFSFQTDDTICLYHRDELKGCMDLELFDELEPHDILTKLGMPINPQAGKY